MNTDLIHCRSTIRTVHNVHMAVCGLYYFDYCVFTKPLATVQASWHDVCGSLCKQTQLLIAAQVTGLPRHCTAFIWLNEVKSAVWIDRIDSSLNRTIYKGGVWQSAAMSSWSAIGFLPGEGFPQYVFWFKYWAGDEDYAAFMCFWNDCKREFLTHPLPTNLSKNFGNFDIRVVTKTWLFPHRRGKGGSMVDS